MYCSKCGSEIPDSSQFCQKCGQQITSASITKVDTTDSSVGWKKSRLSIIAAILSIIVLVISICPTSFDLAFGAYSDDKAFGQSLINATAIRFGLILLAILLDILYLAIKKPSKIVAILALVVVASNIGPTFFINDQNNVPSASLGALVGDVFILIAGIGALCIVIDSFIKHPA
jgi:uncharacterized membrane protein YvbJ